MRIRVSLTDDPIQIPAGWQRIGPGRLERVCAEADKLQQLRDAHTLPQLCDLELEHPGLDEMYAQFLRREDA